MSLSMENIQLFSILIVVLGKAKISPLLFSIYLNDLEHFLLHKGLLGITIDITGDYLMIYMRLFTLLYAHGR